MEKNQVDNAARINSPAKIKCLVDNFLLIIYSPSMKVEIKHDGFMFPKWKPIKISIALKKSTYFGNYNDIAKEITK